MVKVTNRALNKTIEVERIIGNYTQDQPGPTVIFVGGTHGNETSSIFALDRIFEALNKLQIPFKGEMIAAYVGNLEALAKGVRFIDQDMNRIWVPQRLKNLGFFTETSIPKGHEKKEQEALVELLSRAFGRAKGNIYVFDLHTTSSISPPFIAIGDTIRNRNLALRYPLPCVIGFDEEVSGTFMNYINEMGITGIAFEAGEHYSLSAVENNISFIWHTLGITGCMKTDEIPNYRLHWENLAKTDMGDRKLFDLKYAYTIQKGEKFQMKPGFVTFDKIKKGQGLAENEKGEIKAPVGGRIFMPLYQQQGDDGFFIVKEIKEQWLKTSAFLRKIHADRLLPFLPGIQKYKNDRHTLVIPKIYNRPLFMNLLHLLGYRRKRFENDQMIITRRMYDVKVPEMSLVK